MNILENDYLIIETNKSGAELTRIFSKKQNREILWNGDSKYWGRHSPILFPIVGRLKDNETIIEDKVYNITQHGFARDMDFELIEYNTNSISYKLNSNENTRKIYPFSFELNIKYELVNSSVSISWTVKNCDCKDMYFSIGAHPAFNLYSDITDYYLEFSTKGNVKNITLNGPYNEKWINIDTLEKLNLSSNSFIDDAIIYTNVDSVNLKSKKDDYSIKILCEDFPLVGIWSPFYKDTNSTAPFICIEPWYGVCDNINADKIFKNKSFINTIKPLEVFKSSYSINIG